MTTSIATTEKVLIPEQEAMQTLFGKAFGSATLVRLRRDGQLPAHIKVTNRIFYRQSTIDAWLADQEAKHQ